MLYRLFLFNCYVFTIVAIRGRRHYTIILATFIVIFINCRRYYHYYIYGHCIVVAMLCALSYGNVVSCLCLCQIFV